MKKNVFFLILIISGISGATIFLQKEIARWEPKEPVIPVSVKESPQQEIMQSEFFSPVTRVIDGDTIIVDIHGMQERIRLIGVNTPEAVDPRRTVECFGKQASQFLKDTLEGKSVSLATDPTQGDHDKYGRLLRYVFLEDKIFINKIIIEKGYGHEYTYRIPYKYQKEFKQAQENARLEGRGLWAPNVCTE